MTPEQITELLSDHVDDLSVYTVTDANGLPNTVIQFTIPHGIDRPYGGIKSAIRTDERDRVIEISLRPGPVIYDKWSAEQVKQLLDDAVEQSNTPVIVETSIENHYDNLWRTHVETDNPTATTTDIVTWIPDFIDTYQSLYNERKDVVPPTKQGFYMPPATRTGPVPISCWDCETNPVSSVFACKVTATETVHVGLCDECAPAFGNLPYATHSLETDFNRHVGVVINGSNGRYVTGSIPG